MAKIGYARVSTKEQNLDVQLMALRDFGCEQLFFEKLSGTIAHRPQLDACLSFLRKGDVLVVYKLDRLGRSLKNLIELLDSLKDREVGFVSLQDNISTEGAAGQLMLNILGAFAQFERDLILERTAEGRKTAKERGVRFGRKSLVNASTKAKEESCVTLYKIGTPVRKIQEILKIGSSETIYRILRRQGVELKNSVPDNQESSGAE